MTRGDDTGRDLWRWLLSGALVLGVHGGAALALTTWSQSPPAGAPDAAILLDLAPEVAAPTTEKTDVAPDQTVRQQAEKEPDPVEKPLEKEPDPPKPPDPPQKTEVALPPPPKPKPVEKPDRQKVAVNTRPIAAERVAPRATTMSPGALGAAKAEYGNLIVAHLNRHKNYPSGARARHEEGTVMLSFTLDRNGRLLSGRVARGSGFAELDQEALEMLRRAQPFPPAPADLTAATFPFSAPMRYYLR